MLTAMLCLQCYVNIESYPVTMLFNIGNPAVHKQQQQTQTLNLTMKDKIIQHISACGTFTGIS